MAFLLASCFGDVRMEDASVWKVGERVCFAPGAGGKEVPKLHALEVNDISVTPSRVAWSFYYPPDKARPASSADCLPYGVIPVGALQNSDAQALKVGHVYEVYINARYSDPYSPVFGFSRRFCLKGSAQAWAVVLVDYDDVKGWDSSVCR
jgi:hypothetical protein